MISSRDLDVLRITSEFSDQYLASSSCVVRAKGLVYPLDIIFLVAQGLVALRIGERSCTVKMMARSVTEALYKILGSGFSGELGLWRASHSKSIESWE